MVSVREDYIFPAQGNILKNDNAYSFPQGGTSVAPGRLDCNVSC